MTNVLIQSYIRRRMDEVRSVLRAFLEGLSDGQIPVPDEDQWRPEPQGPFLTLKFLGGLRRVGAYDILVKGADNQFYLHGHREATISIKARGQSAHDRYENLVRATDMLGTVQWELGKPGTVALFKSQGVVFIRDNGVVNTTVQEDTSFPSRATIDIEIRFSLSELVTDQNVIEHVGVNGRIDADFDGSFESLPALITPPLE